MDRQDDTTMDVNLIEGVETWLANGMFKIAHPDVEKPRHLRPVEKIALEKKNEFLTAKAESRDTHCWHWDCERKASVWVREVGFDFKGEKAAAMNHIAISSDSYEGSVPGFCLFCVGFAPQELAEAVFVNKPETFWGVRPNRWFVSFTDGTKQGGMCVELDPRTQALPTIKEEYITHG